MVFAMLLSISVVSLLLLCQFSTTFGLFLKLSLKICYCFHKLFSLIESVCLAFIAFSLVFNFGGLFELAAGLNFDSISRLVIVATTIVITIKSNWLSDR